MSTSAFPFLDGRTTLDDPVTRAPRRRTNRAGGVFEQVRRHVQRAQLSSGKREHDRRDETDAYLDRTGLSSVDWVGVLTQQVHR
jgi:hypothetical protein